MAADRRSVQPVLCLSFGQLFCQHCPGAATAGGEYEKMFIADTLLGRRGADLQ